MEASEILGFKPISVKGLRLKFYGIAVSLNFLPLLLGALNCSGEKCMAIIIGGVLGLFWAMAYLPYFLLGHKIIKSKWDHILLFFLPTIIALGILFFIALDSYARVPSNILIFIGPNSILQGLFGLYYRKEIKRYTAITTSSSEKKENSKISS